MLTLPVVALCKGSVISRISADSVCTTSPLNSSCIRFRRGLRPFSFPIKKAVCGDTPTGQKVLAAITCWV